jgi:signal transduction histidine kinase
MRLRDEFLATAAHDLRNPLSVILGSAQLLVRQARRNPAAPVDQKVLRMLDEQAGRMTRLVGHLLDASRVEQGQLLSSREPADLVEIAQTVCGREYSDQHQISLEAHAPVLGCYDTFRIEQLLDNLLLNAVKYSPQGGEVTVAVWREGNEARLTVTDSGVGIDAGELPHLFDRFRRGANAESRNLTGTGLGLFICRGIAEEHGGRIWATSTLGKGSAFHVVLPAEPLGEPEVPLRDRRAAQKVGQVEPGG